MVTLRDLVRERLKALGLKQQDLASLLGIDPSQLSGVLTGQRQAPVEKAAEWARALQLTGQDEADLVDALHLAAASERVRAIVDRLETERDAAATTLLSYRNRVSHVLRILYHVEPAEGVGRPPPDSDDRQRFRHLLDELISEYDRARGENPPNAG